MQISKFYCIKPELAATQLESFKYSAKVFCNQTILRFGFGEMQISLKAAVAEIIKFPKTSFQHNERE